MIDFENLVMCLGAAVAGIPQSLTLMLWTFAICLVLGTLIALCRVFEVPVLKPVFDVVMAILKSLPTNLVLLVVYLIITNSFVDLFGALIPGLTIKDLDLNAVSIAGLTLCMLPVISEDIRSGLLSVNRGQFEAGYSVGLTGLQTFWAIVFPQAVRAAIPPLTGSTLSLFKTTALVSIIGNTDIMSSAVNAAGDSYCYLEAYVAAALVFWILGYAFERLSIFAERQFGRSVKTLAA